MSQPLRKRGIAVPDPVYSTPSSRTFSSSQDRFKPKKPSGVIKVLKKVKFDHILSISLIWLVALYYFQRIHPHSSISSCDWSKWESFESVESNPHRILLLADPQIVDDHTYPSRFQWIQDITRQLSDNYMKINYKLMQQKLAPDSTIFLGDLFDGGREWQDDEKWYDEWKRFNKIFPRYPNRKTYYNILGNHDAGWDKTMNKTILNRFKTIFGDSNDFENLGNHTILFIDTIALSATNNNDSSIAKEARYYLNNLTQTYLPHLDEVQQSKNEKLLPRILLTHVPFFRDPRQMPCRGPREHKSPFPLVNGGTFQTVIFPDLTNELLDKLQPDIIFSGDDHDYCEIDHHYFTNYLRPGQQTKQRTTREITVKSFSMNMGVRYPAAQLLSLYNPLDDFDNKNQETYQTHICFPYSPFPVLHTYAFILLSTLVYWVLLSFYPRVYDRIKQKILGKINNYQFLKNDIKSYPPFSSDNLDFSDGESLYNTSLIEEKDYIQFSINFFLQIFMIYLLFVYFFLTV